VTPLTTNSARFASNVGFPGTVTEPSAGTYCITPPAGVAPGSPIALSLAGGTAGFVVQDNSAVDCSGTAIEVVTANVANTARVATIDFNIVVP
jgi:hypothetical protein